MSFNVDVYLACSSKVGYNAATETLCISVIEEMYPLEDLDDKYSSQTEFAYAVGVAYRKRHEYYDAARWIELALSYFGDNDEYRYNFIPPKGWVMYKLGNMYLNHTHRLSRGFELVEESIDNMHDTECRLEASYTYMRCLINEVGTQQDLAKVREMLDELWDGGPSVCENYNRDFVEMDGIVYVMESELEEDPEKAKELLEKGQKRLYRSLMIADCAWFTDDGKTHTQKYEYYEKDDDLDDSDDEGDIKGPLVYVSRTNEFDLDHEASQDQEEMCSEWVFDEVDSDWRKDE
jgi:hypothetical protein